MNKRPQPHELAEYYNYYVGLVENDNFLAELESNMGKTISFLQSLDKDKWDYRYAEGKWSVKEIICHIIDGERVFQYRAMRFARNDQTDLPGYDHDSYVKNSNAEGRSIESILEEYRLVRQSTITLFKSFTDEMLDRKGTANNSHITVLGIGFVTVGHEIHHLNVLKERYL